MKHPDYNSPAELKQVLDINGFSMQKKFGQNFLINEDARRRLVDALELTEGMKVWEVGPGLGAMTNTILERGADLTVFEIDRGFASLISQFFEDYNKKGAFRIVEGDVLKTWKGQFEKAGQADRFFGNLPYNIAATIIADTIENNVRFEKCVFTVQKEVAERICAAPGKLSLLALSVQVYGKADMPMIIPAAAFYPEPNVDSAVVRIELFNEPLIPQEKMDDFFTLAKAGFGQKRKTLRNSLSSGFHISSSEAELRLKKAEIEPARRAETLTIEEWKKLMASF